MVFSGMGQHPPGAGARQAWCGRQILYRQVALGKKAGSRRTGRRGERERDREREREREEDVGSTQ
jgi:hypothetical protein